MENKSENTKTAKCATCKEIVDTKLYGTRLMKHNDVRVVDGRIFFDRTISYSYGYRCYNCIDMNPCRGCGDELVKYTYCRNCA